MNIAEVSLCNKGFYSIESSFYPYEQYLKFTCTIATTYVYLGLNHFVVLATFEGACRIVINQMTEK